MTSVSTGERNNNKDNNNVINTVINTVTKIRLIKTFSIPPDKLHIYDAFNRVAKREAGSRGFSETLLKAMEEYVKRHGLGNPQLLITHYVKPNEPSPTYTLCHYQRGVNRDGQIFCTNPSIIPPHEMISERGLNGQWVSGVKCYSCKYNKLRK